MARTALAAAVACFAQSCFFIWLMPRVWTAYVGRTMSGLDDITTLEHYLITYSVGYLGFPLGTPLFIGIWIMIAKPVKESLLGARGIWWVAVFVFILYAPTALFPLSILALWILFSGATLTGTGMSTVSQNDALTG